jgi:hypothetical protein
MFQLIICFQNLNDFIFMVVKKKIFKYSYKQIGRVEGNL